MSDGQSYFIVVWATQRRLTPEDFVVDVHLSRPLRSPRILHQFSFYSRGLSHQHFAVTVDEQQQQQQQQPEHPPTELFACSFDGSCSSASANEEEISSEGSVEFEPIVDGTDAGIPLSTEVVPRGSVEDEESVTDTSSTELSHYAATCLPRASRESLPSNVEMFQYMPSGRILYSIESPIAPPGSNAILPEAEISACVHSGQTSQSVQSPIPPSTPESEIPKRRRSETSASFPLYQRALQFFDHSENMVRIAVRTTTLNIFKDHHEACYLYVYAHTSVPYFSHLAEEIRRTILTVKDSFCLKSRLANRGCFGDLVAETSDHLHYIDDIFALGVTEPTNVPCLVLLLRLFLPIYVHSLTRRHPPKVSLCLVCTNTFKFFLSTS
ncbi:hypothetical protein Aperf_G00000003842 [Anoplocephala perfoliata]